MSFFSKADVQGILFLALGLFVAVSLATYYPFDQSFNSLSYEPVQNYCGYAGAFLSDLLYQLLGLGSWLIVFSIFKFSSSSFSGRKIKKRRTFLLEGVLVVTICSLLTLFLNHYKFFDQKVTIGGALGSMMISTLQPVFHKTGTLILLIFSLIGVFAAQNHRPFRYYIKDILRVLSIVFYGLKIGITKIYFLVVQLFSGILKRSKIPPSHEINQNPFLENEEEIIEEDNEEEFEFQNKTPSFFGSMISENKNWEKPSHTLIPEPEKSNVPVSKEEIKEQTQKLIDKLAQFSITGEMVGVKTGPAVTLFEFRPAESVKVGKITQLADDLSMALSAESLRIIAPIPGRDVVGIEASNSTREIVHFKDIIKDSFFKSKNWDLPIIIGRNVEGKISVQELCQIPHLMVAGTTGSGKSVFITSLLAGFLMHHTPETLKLILIDPKQVDLASFADIPHMLFPTIVNVSKSLEVLQWAIAEMNKRYRSLSQFNVRGIKNFNYLVSQLSEEEMSSHETNNINADTGQDYYYAPIPYICIVIEEFGDLMSTSKKNQVEQSVVRLAQMARACGIHLILSMQSPRKDVVTGLIKTNIPGRISFKVASKIDSRVILDESGAERLLAKGDMLFLSPSSAKIKRCHGPLITENEIRLIVNHWKEQGAPQYQTLENQTSIDNNFNLDSIDDEETEKYLEIRSYVSSLKYVSTSSLQRKFRLGYPRAARMMEKFEEEGIVGPAQGSKPREVLQNK